MFHAYRYILGGCAAIVLGFMLLAVVPGVQRWRGLAAFPLGVIFIWLGVKRLREIAEQSCVRPAKRSLSCLL